MSVEEVGLYHVTLVCTLHSQRVQNGFYFATKSSHSSPDHAYNANLLALDFHTYISDKVMDFANNQLGYNRVIVSTVIPRHGPIAEFRPETGQGVQQNESLPSYCAAVLSLRTGFGGRSSFGRCYFAAISEDDSVSGLLTVGAFARLQAIGTALIGRYSSSGTSTDFEYVLYSHKLGDTPATPPDSGFAHGWAGVRTITQAIARRQLYTQRHRLIGHGA